MSTTLEAVSFITARRNTDRSACERWLKSQNLPDDAAVCQAAKERWSKLAFYNDPLLRDLAWRVVGACKGPQVNGTTPFPCTVWYGGATKTYGGLRFTGTLSDYITHVLEARAREIAAKRTGWVVTPTTNVDGHRTNASTTAMHALNFDCDGRGTWDKLSATLGSLGVCFVAYQTGGWTPITPKWHIIMPLAKPFDTSTPEKIAAWKSAYTSARVIFGALAELPGEGFDPTVETPSIPIFVTERRAENDPPRATIHHFGAAFNIETMVQMLPAIEEEEITTRPRSTATVALDDARLEQIVSILCGPMEKILSGRRLLYLALPGALLDRGVSPDDVRTIICEISLRCPGDPRYSQSEFDAKHKEHLHYVETTINRFESGEQYTRIGTVNESWPEVADAIDNALPDPYLTAVLAKLEAGRSTPAVEVPGAFTEASEPVQKVVDLHALRKHLKNLRRKKLKSKDVEEQIRGVILDALLKGEDLVPYIEPGKPVTSADGRPIDRNRALSTAMSMVAFKLPVGTHFEGVAAVVRPSLHAMLKEGESIDALMKKAEHAFLRSLGKKIEQDEKRRAEDLADAARYGELNNGIR
jgi:hypothetical protein